MNFTAIIAVVAGMGWLSAGVAGFLYVNKVKSAAATEERLEQAKQRLVEINNVVKAQDAIDASNRALSNDDLFRGLLDDSKR